MATRHRSCKPVSIMTIIACCALKTTGAACIFIKKKTKTDLLQTRVLIIIMYAT